MRSCTALQGIQWRGYMEVTWQFVSTSSCACTRGLIFQSFTLLISISTLELFRFIIDNTDKHIISYYNMRLICSLRYQSSQQHPQAQHLMQYHSMGQYAEGSREEPVMTELSVLRELPSSHQELLSHQSYYPQGSQQTELDYHPNFRESQPPAFHVNPQQDFPGHHEELGGPHQQLQPVNPAPGECLPTEAATTIGHCQSPNSQMHYCWPLYPIPCTGRF